MHSARSATLRAYNLFLILVCSYITFVVLGDLFPWLSEYDEKRLLQCLLLIGIALITISLSKLRHQLLDSIIALPPLIRTLLAALLIIGIVSAAISERPKIGFSELSLYLLLFFCSIIIAISRKALQQRFDNLLICVLVVVAALYFIKFLLGYVVFIQQDNLLRPNDLFMNFSNRRFFNHLQTWTLPLLLVPLATHTQRKTIFFTALIAATGWWIMLFTSNGRGSLIALILSSIVVLVAFRRFALPWLKWMTATFTAGLAIYFLMFVLIPATLKLSINLDLSETVARRTDDGARLQLFARAIHIIEQHPWTGIGPGQYTNCVEGEAGLVLGHPHNAVLQIASEWGLIALVISVTIIILGMWAWYDHARKDIQFAPAKTKSMYVALLASSTAAGAHSLVSGIIVMPLSQILLIIVAGWMIAINPQRPADHRIKQIHHLAASLLIISASLGLAWHLAKDVSNIHAEHGSLDPTFSFKPRFWLNTDICADHLSYTEMISPPSISNSSTISFLEPRASLTD